MTALKFYMTPGSCSIGIHILLEELDEVFEVTVINLPAGDHFKPAYTGINPKSTIPCLMRRDGSVLTELPVIAYWLGRSHPRAGFWPMDIEQETRAWEIMVYVAATVHGQGFARFFAAGSFSRHAAEHDEIRTLGRRIAQNGLALLGERIAPEAYALGAFSVVDPVLFYVEFWADKTGVVLPPRLQAHYRLMLTRDAVRRVLREEGYNPESLGRFSINPEAAAAAHCTPRPRSH